MWRSGVSRKASQDSTGFWVVIVEVSEWRSEKKRNASALHTTARQQHLVGVPSNELV